MRQKSARPACIDVSEVEHRCQQKGQERASHAKCDSTYKKRNVVEFRVNVMERLDLRNDRKVVNTL